ncbi:MAG: Asp-tRNA(Asn)/Glu-tRNA(Gln) amidotransferase GatCAB subunit A [Verrucomicrobiaceae bacterium]|nr:Asp-tRNA(Asn)/Glu-tRNA(Gln) amidotransferase GatCAB subunit A [Verrucomicrobiaceae bacterium]
MNLAAHTIADLRRMLLAGETTPREIVESVATAITQKDEQIGGYLSADLDRAMVEAEAADLKAPLGGIPVALKDNINALEHPCSCASRFLEKGYQSPYDATVSARLKKAGAVLYGRTNLDEFAMGSSTENSAFRQTRNPHDPGRIPGGSSGGSAAVVAADMAVAALGSDTGGSIRQPASHCGVVGLKPSYGRVSRFGLVAFASSLDQIGPLTKTVEDAALLLQVIAGGDERDSTCLDAALPDYTANLAEGVAGMKLGVPKEFFAVEGLDPEVRGRVEDALGKLEAAGAELVEVGLPSTSFAVATYYILAPAEASSNLSRYDGVRYGHRVENGDGIIEMYARSRARGFGPEVKRRIILGTYVLSSGYSGKYYLKAQKARTLIQQDYQQAFQSVDAIVGPVSPSPARRIGEFADDPLQDYLADVYTISANLAGICGISVPCGNVKRGASLLPVGLQILGPHLGETTILRVGRAWEMIRDGA